MILMVTCPFSTDITQHHANSNPFYGEDGLVMGNEQTHPSPVRLHSSVALATGPLN